MGFDSLYFESEVLIKVNSYIKHLRPLLFPECPYLLVTRNGTQHTQLSNLFSRIVFLATGKYIHPTRYRQVIETESSASLSVEEQNVVSMDQKHSSRVAKVHYQKQRSRDVSIKSKGLLKNVIVHTSNEKTVLCTESSTASNTCEVASDVMWI